MRHFSFRAGVFILLGEVMLKPRTANRTTRLTEHSAALSSTTARIIARSAELVARTITASQAAALACEEASRLRAEIRRARLESALRGAGSRALQQVAQMEGLLLTPTMLREIAVEFAALASTAATPEARWAFRSLEFRYIALAAGFDTRCIGSRRLH
jgi:hypothetical protein